MERVLENKELFKALENGKGYYEIRLESIGGLGANLCGKMLGELGIKYLDLNATSFSSYGSEKTGTPVKAFIRYCNADREIKVHYPVTEPNLLVVFHKALLKDESVLKGCSEKTTIIVGLESENDSIDDIKCNYKEIYGLQAQKIAIETRSRINVVMLGAVLKLMGLENEDVGIKICEDTLGKKYPDSLKGNIEGIKRGFNEVKQIDNNTTYGTNKNTNENAKIKDKKDIQTVYGYDNAPIGGINTRIGSSVIADLSPSRQGYIPLFIKDKCINCGLCHSTCPDMVFQFKKGEYKGKEMMINQGLDYYHCKGCLRCVDICPVNALVQGREAKHSNKEYFITNQELIRKPYYYEKSGADGYITSESFLTEKRIDGGEV